MSPPTPIDFSKYETQVPPPPPQIDFTKYEASAPKTIPTYEQASKEAQDYIGRGANLLVGSEGIKDITKGAIGLSEAAAPYVKAFLGHPKIQPIVDVLEKEINKLPGTDLAKAGWKIVKPWLKGEAETPPTYPGASLPEHPGVFPGAPFPTATPEQLNPALTSEARTLPGMHSPEVVKPPAVATAQPIPARPGLALPGETASVPPRTPIPSKAAQDALRADKLETSNIQDQIRNYAEGQDRQELEEVARERLSAQMPRKVHDISEAATPAKPAKLTTTVRATSSSAPSGTSADADLEQLLKDSLAQIQKKKARQLKELQ